MAWTNVRTWLDGPHRGEGEVPAELRQFVFQMQRRAVGQENDDARQEQPIPHWGQRLGEVSVPVLMMVGSHDQPDMVVIARQLAVGFPDGRLVVLAGVAHLPPLEDPDGFLATVLPFLDGEGE